MSDLDRCSMPSCARRAAFGCLWCRLCAEEVFGCQ